jgi:thiamine pyrophosphokinase
MAPFLLQDVMVHSNIAWRPKGNNPFWATPGKNATMQVSSSKAAITHMEKMELTTQDGRPYQNKRIHLFGGGELGSWALADITPGDVLYGIDRGALFLIRHGFSPDLAIGDFDSVTTKQAEQIRQTSNQFISCDPIYKDLTDTEMALRYALDQQPVEIVLKGATGTRMDHTLANIQLLGTASRDVVCRIVDAHNRITIVHGPATLTLHNSRFSHISLLPLSEIVTGIFLSGFQYPLLDATLQLGQTLGISNVLVEDEGCVSIASGRLLVMESVD